MTPSTNNDPCAADPLDAAIAHAVAESFLALAACGPGDIAECRRLQALAITTPAASWADHDARASVLRRALRDEAVSDHALALLAALLADSRRLRLTPPPGS